MGSRAGAPSPGLRPINAAHSSGSLPPRPAGPSTCARESLPMSCAAHSRLLPRSPIQALLGPAPSSGEGSLRKGSQQAANTACPLLGWPHPALSLCAAPVWPTTASETPLCQGDTTPLHLYPLPRRHGARPPGHGAAWRPPFAALRCPPPPPRRCKHGPGQRGFLFFTVFPR